jgi:hypothetical protein
MVPPFNNFECLFRLILDGGTSVFLLAGRGGGYEEAVRSIIRVHVGVCIRLGLYITYTPSLYLPPCTPIYTPIRVKSIQHGI